MTNVGLLSPSATRDLDEAQGRVDAALSSATARSISPSASAEPSALDQNTLKAFEDTAVKYNVPVDVLMAMAEKDSNFNALSRTRGPGPKLRGIINMSDEDVRGHGINPYMPEQSIDTAGKKMRGLMDNGLSVEDAVKALASNSADPSQWGPQAAEYASDVLSRTKRLKDTYYPPEPPAAPAAPAPALESAPAPSPGVMGTAKDLGLSLLSGLDTAAADVHGLASKVLPERVVSAISEADKYLTGKSTEEIFKANQKAINEAYSPKMRESLQKKWWDQEKGAFGDAFSDWRAYAGPILQSLPETLISSGPALKAAKGAYAVAIMRGATPAEAAKRAATIATIAGAAIEGGLGGAQSEREVREEIEKIPPETLRQSEAFKALTAQGMSEDAARQALARDLGTRAFVTGGLATGAFGGMGDRVIAKTFLNSLGEQGWKSIAAKLGKSAVGEGLFEEAPQSALQQVAQNESVQKADPNKSLTDDVANQGLGGAVTGGVMGAGMGAVFHGATREEAPSEPQQPGPTPQQPAAPEPVAPAPAAPANQGPLSRVLNAGAPDHAALANIAGKRVVLTDKVGQMTGHIVGQDEDGVMFKGDDGAEQLISHDELTSGAAHIVEAPNAPTQEAPRAAPPDETGPSAESIAAAVTPQEGEDARASLLEKRLARLKGSEGESTARSKVTEGPNYLASENGMPFETKEDAAKAVVDAGRNADEYTIEPASLGTGFFAKKKIDVRQTKAAGSVAPGDSNLVTEAQAKTRFTPKQPSDRPLSDMDMPELRERMKFIAQQAKSGGGWNKLLSTERAKVEKEINARVAGAKSEQPAPTVAKADESKKSLPADLAGAKPRYSFGAKQFSLSFKSDIDKAAFIAAQKTPSKRDADYVKFVSDATGMAEAQVREHGAKVREAIKAQARDANPGALNVGEVYERAAKAEQQPAPAESTPAAPVVSDAKPLDSFDATAKRFVGATVQPIGARVTVVDEHGLMVGRIVDQSRDGVLFRSDDGEEHLFDNQEVANGTVRISPETTGATPEGAGAIGSTLQTNVKTSIWDSNPAASDLNLFPWEPSDKGGMQVNGLTDHLTRGPDGPLIQKMIDAGKVVIHDDASTLPGRAPDGVVRGVTMPDGTIHLVAGNLTPADARAVLLHEAFHAGAEPLIGSRGWRTLMSHVRTATDAAIRRKAAGQSRASDSFWRASLDQARRSGAPDAHLAEEIAAYAIEHREAAPAGLREIADNLIGAVKAFILRKFGRQLGDVTPGQLRALAVAALRSWDAPEVVSTDRGARYSMAGDGPVNEKRESTRFDNAKNALNDFVTNAMVGKVTPLALVPVRPLFLELAANLPSARHYLRTKEAMDAMRNHLSNEVAPIVEKWGTFALRFKADNRALMDLMHDTTIAQIDPSKSSKFAENDPRHGEYLELRKRYDALPKVARELYNEVRDLYEKRADESEKEVLANMRRAIDAAVKRAEREHAAELQRIKDEGLTGQGRADAIAAADLRLATAETRTKRMRAARLKRLRQQFESNRLEGPYFPLSRFGQFYVTVRDAEGKVISFSRFESASEQRAFADDMRKDKANKVEVGLLEEKTKAESFLDPRFVADVDAILEAGHASTTVRDQVWQRYLETLPDLSMRKHRIHRKNRAGYSTDALRAFASSMFHSAHQISRLRYGLELGENLDTARQEVRDAKDPVRSGAVFNEMKKAHDFTMNPDIASWSQNVTSAVFLWTMAANISSALVNLDQSVSKGIPTLAFDEETGSVGMKQASAHLANAFIDFMRGKGYVANSASLTADERDAIAKSYERGVIDKTQAHDLAGVAESGVSYNPLWAKFTKLASAPLHHTERLNREVTFLAAYRIAREAGLTHEQAIVKAGDLTWMTHYDTQASSKARFMRASGPRAIFALKSFQANVLFRVFRDAQQSWKGETKEARRAALGRFVSTLALTLPMAGLKGAFGMSMILAIAGLFGGDDDPEETLRKAVLETAGDSVIGHAVGGMLMDGVPGYLTGIALSGRIGMSDLWFRSNDRDMNAEQQFVYVLEQLGGAPIGLANQIWQGVDAIQKGDLARGVERVSPAFIRNVIKAGRYAQEGVRDKDGNPIVESVAPQDVLKQLIGFTPAEIADRYARNTFQRNEQERIKAERSRAMQAAARSRMAEDDAAQERAEEKVDRFNDRFPEKRITPKSIRQEIRRLHNKSGRMEFGVDLDDKLEERIKDRTAPSIYSRE